jgi:fucose permease
VLGAWCLVPAACQLSGWAQAVSMRCYAVICYLLLLLITCPISDFRTNTDNIRILSWPVKDFFFSICFPTILNSSSMCIDDGDEE